MKRVMLAAAAASTMMLAACGGGEVVVQAQVQGEGEQPVPLGGLPLQVLPYDRDAVFDSLQSAYSTPEPEIPAQLSLLQDSIATANQAWTQATADWNAARDSLQQLNSRLQGMSRASGDYIVLYRQVNELFAEVDRAEGTMDREFARFTSLQGRYTAQAEETQRTREQWGDAAFADADVALGERLKASRRRELADTTDANGLARLTGLKSGQWWIHARYELPFDELYWNVPVTVEGDVVQVLLTRETAEVRPKL
ncbi:MAG: hypothetical protein WD054_02200 [Gemmatimonadota bacterium]